MLKTPWNVCWKGGEGGAVPKANGTNKKKQHPRGNGMSLFLIHSITNGALFFLYSLVPPSALVEVGGGTWLVYLLAGFVIGFALDHAARILNPRSNDTCTGVVLCDCPAGCRFLATFYHVCVRHVVHAWWQSGCEYSALRIRFAI